MKESQFKNKDLEKNWAVLLHLSFNFAGGIAAYGGIREKMELDEDLWNDALIKMANSGINMVLLNLDDAVRWESHPEISVKNAWTPDRLRKELDRIRRLNIEPIPMLNLSTSHDAWMKTYSRMVSSPIYYTFCRNLIAEAVDIFNKPRFFHLGMDEESAKHQGSRYDYVVVRKNDLWWNDLYFFMDEVERGGSRAWVWSDYLWNHPDQFFSKMPTSILQSNWYYGGEFDRARLPEKTRMYVQSYIDLDLHGYDQMPTGKFYDNDTHDSTIPYDEGNEDSVMNTVRFCSENISHERLRGFLTTFWKPTTERYRNRIMTGIDVIGGIRTRYGNDRSNIVAYV